LRIRGFREAQLAEVSKDLIFYVIHRASRDSDQLWTQFSKLQEGATILIDEINRIFGLSREGFRRRRVDDKSQIRPWCPPKQ